MTQEEIEKANWIKVGRSIYKCTDTDKYHFVCETDMLDETPYDSVMECEAAMKLYAASL